MSALRELGMLYLAPTVEPSIDPDPGYAWWPSWLGFAEELGYILSEDEHPWLTIAGSLLFFGLLIAVVAGFALLAPARLP